jgi:hypothetical protein
VSNNLLVKPSSQSVFTSPTDPIDTAVEETTAGVGALVTQLIRHSLYHTAHSLQDRLNGMVHDRLEVAVSETLPEIKRSAEEVADQVSARRANEVAQQHVEALETRTQVRIAEAEQAAGNAVRQVQEVVNETAEGLTGRIAATEQKVHETAQTLVGRIDESEQQTRDAVRATAADLTARLEQTSQQVEAGDAGVRGDLTDQIRQAEARVQETTAALVSREIDHLRQKSKGTVAALRQDIAALGERAAGLEGTLRQVLDRLHTEEEKRRRLEEEAQQALALFKKEARRRFEELDNENKGLWARVTELEKPRGLRALWQWLFGRRKQPAAPLPTESA